MKVKLITIISIVLAGIIVASITIGTAISRNNEYESYIKSARANAENQVPYTACQKYRQAFAIKCEDENIYQEYLTQAKILGEDFYKTAVESYVKYFPESPAAYEALCNYYYENASYKNVIKVAKNANELGLATTQVRDQYIECFHMYKYITRNLDEAGTFLGDYALVKKNGLYGFATKTGGYLISPRYIDANVFLGNSTAVNDGAEWYMINTGGYKIARPSQPVEDLSFVSNSNIRVAKNGRYGFTKSNFNIAEELPYEFASNYKNGVAAVKSDGKWALIDADGKQITEFIFDDVLLDEYETCINNGVIFAKIDNKYYMYDSEGSRVNDQGYDNACPFVANEAAAVCIDGKWGFSDAEGNMVIEPEYEEAKSFSNGLASVKIDGKWGYINKNGEIRLACVFEDAKPFSGNGIAAVKENGKWNYIKLLAYFN